MCNDINVTHDEYTIPPEQAENAKKGIIPPMFFDNDEYFSDFGAFALGTAVDGKLRELGYFDDEKAEEDTESATETAASENISESSVSGTAVK